MTLQQLLNWADRYSIPYSELYLYGNGDELALPSKVTLHTFDPKDPKDNPRKEYRIELQVRNKTCRCMTPRNTYSVNIDTPA